MLETVEVMCPYCGEWVEVVLDPGSEGEMVQDCEVCCNPWQLTVRRDEGGTPRVEVERSE
jgi:Cysteine-rich CPXCG